MSTKYDDILTEAFSQADGQVEIALDRLANYFQVTVIPAQGATGSLEFQVRMRADADYEQILDATTSSIQTLELTGATKTFTLEGYWAESLRVSPQAITGSYTILIQQGDIN